MSRKGIPNKIVHPHTVIREAARARGELTYESGYPCKYGHGDVRWTINRRCVECSRRAQRAARRVRDADERAAAQRRYLSKPEKRAKHQRACRNYEARKRSVEGAHSAQDVQDILKRQGHRCALCRARLTADAKMEVDHIHPLARGGSNDRRNLQVLCQPCNRRKGAADPVDYSRRIGLLI